MDGFLPIFFLLVVLKIPVLGALWLVWWAAKSPEAESSQDDSGGGPNRRRPMPRSPAALIPALWRVRQGKAWHCRVRGPVPVRRNL